MCPKKACCSCHVVDRLGFPARSGQIQGWTTIWVQFQAITRYMIVFWGVVLCPTRLWLWPWLWPWLCPFRSPLAPPSVKVTAKWILHRCCPSWFIAASCTSSSSLKACCHSTGHVRIIWASFFKSAPELPGKSPWLEEIPLISRRACWKPLKTDLKCCAPWRHQIHGTGSHPWWEAKIRPIL